MVSVRHPLQAHLGVRIAPIATPLIWKCGEASESGHLEEHRVLHPILRTDVEKRMWSDSDGVVRGSDRQRRVSQGSQTY